MRRVLEVFRASAWLGWQIEANWADPFLFLVYAIAKPLATTLILYFMVAVVSQASATGETFLFLFVGNTLFLYVTEVLIGVSWAVFRDREDFESLKYIYAAPIPLLTYLLGRAATKIATSTIGVIVAILFGKFALGLPLRLDPAQLAALVPALFLGIFCVAWLGIALAGASLIVARHSMNMNEGLAGTLYLLSGAVFPLEVLPTWAQTISLGLPVTYWLELTRRIITGRGYAAPLAAHADGALWGTLAVTTAVVAVAAWLWFRGCERFARARGLIDWKTNY